VLSFSALETSLVVVGITRFPGFSMAYFNKHENDAKVFRQ